MEPTEYREQRYTKAGPNEAFCHYDLLRVQLSDGRCPYCWTKLTGL